MTIITYVYIDGFNLYYGALKGTLFKWLDPKLLCQNILPGNYKIESILYCTARVKNTLEDPTVRKRQHMYTRALEAYIPELDIAYGDFRKRTTSEELKLTEPPIVPIIPPIITTDLQLDTAFPPISVTTSRWEEKMSDVNLATNLVNDANRDKFECAVVISNDSDLAAALRITKNECKREVWVLNPDRTGAASKHLKQYANHFRNIRQGTLARSQLPNPIPSSNLWKPDAW